MKLAALQGKGLCSPVWAELCNMYWFLSIRQALTITNTNTSSPIPATWEASSGYTSPSTVGDMVFTGYSYWSSSWGSDYVWLMAKYTTEVEVQGLVVCLSTSYSDYMSYYYKKVQIRVGNSRPGYQNDRQIFNGKTF